MAANGISTLETKQLRQVAKLNLAAINRAADGNPRTTYDITQLPTQYEDNDIVDNPNVGGLVVGRPWISAPIIPGSLLFSGSNYLTVDGNASTAMGTGDFTWECFVYPTSSTDYQTFIDTRTNPVGGDTAGFYFGTDSNTLTPIVYTDHQFLASSIDMTLNAWNHVALTRLDGTLTLWVNGASGGTVADTTSLSEQRVYIGGSSILKLTGYMSTLRMLKGSAEYTATFTPPSEPLTAITNTVLLLNSSFDANFLKDSSINNFTVTNTGSVTSDARSPFLEGYDWTAPSGWAGYEIFNGTSQRLSVPASSDWAPATGAFTVEFVVNFQAGGGSFPRVFSLGSYPSASIACSIEGSDTPTIYFWMNGGIAASISTAGELFTGMPSFRNNYHHVVLQRNASGWVNIYIDGNKVTDNTTANTTNLSNTTSELAIAVEPQSPSGYANWMKGYLTNFRWTNAAVYPDTSFTVMSAALTALPQTKLLLLMATDPALNDDSSASAKTVTATGTPTWHVA